MSVPVKLSDIIDGMDMQMDESSTYLDKDTGEVSFFTDEEIRTAADDDTLDNPSQWERESIQKARKFLYDKDASFVSLPTKFDIHEYRIMEKFCYFVDDEDISDSLSRAIRGSGAFRRFKDGVYRFDIQDDWYKYRAEALKKIAIEWCEDNDVEYIDDTIKSPSDDDISTEEAEESTGIPGITIRHAELRDGAQLARLRWDFSTDEVQASGQSFPKFLDGFTEFLNNALSSNRWHIWVAERDEKIIGNIYVRVIPKVPRPGRFLAKHGYVTNTYVMPAERNSSIGSELLNQVIAWARELKLESLIVWPSEASVEFYQRHGFTQSTDVMELHIGS